MRRGRSCVSNPAQELWHFVVIARHHEQKAVGAVLKDKPDVQPHADFEIITRQLAYAKDRESAGTLPVDRSMAQVRFGASVELVKTIWKKYSKSRD